MSWLFSQREARRKLKEMNDGPSEPMPGGWLILLIIAGVIIFMIVR